MPIIGLGVYSLVDFILLLIEKKFGYVYFELSSLMEYEVLPSSNFLKIDSYHWIQVPVLPLCMTVQITQLLSFIQ